MKRGSGALTVAGVLAWVMLSGTAQAGDASWAKTTGGTYDWTNVVNWLPSASCPDGAGQKAYVTNDFVGVQTLQLRKNVTLGALSVGDAAASSGNYGVTIKNASGESFALLFDSGASGVPAEIALNHSGTPTTLLSAPLVLGSDLLVKFGGSDSANHPNITFGAAATLNGRALIFTNGVYGQSQASFGTGSEIMDSGSIINQSASCINVDGFKAFPGRVIANSKTTGSNVGTFTFNTGGFTNAVEMIANGYLTNGINQMGGTLHSGNRSAYTVNPGQRWTRRQITLNGGSVDEFGQTASNNSGSPTNDWQRGLEYVRSEIATIRFNSGYSYVGIAADLTTTTGTFFNVGALQRGPGATAYLNGPNASNRLFVAGNGSTWLIGAGGAAGSQTQSVIPWMGAFLSGNAANPQTFATLTASGSVRGVTDAEYASSLTAGAGANVQVSSLALAADATVNALRLSYIGTSNIGTNRTLTVASGGVLFIVNDKMLGQSGSPQAGTLNFGSAEGVVWVIGAGTNTIGARITGTGGLVKTGTGVLTLTGPNSHSGTNHVSGGTLRVGDGVTPGKLGSGDVVVHVGGVLNVSCADALADRATLSLDRYGLFSGRVQLDAGVNETVRYLFLGGAAMPAGTYGSSASAAAVKNDQYFMGSGVLTVARDATKLTSGTVIQVQ